MIARTWTAVADDEGADGYRQHFERVVIPRLHATNGFDRAYLLDQSVDGARALTVLTLWDSWEAIEAFAGDEPSLAVVEDGARAVLTTFDDRVDHHEVAASACSPPPAAG